MTVLSRVKKKPVKDYKTIWQLTFEMFELLAAIDKNGGRHTPIMVMELKNLEREINARDGN